MSILNLFNLGSFGGTSDTGPTYPLPADAVLLWDRASESDAVPNGFSLYTSADNRLIQGTTTLGDIGVTGGSPGTLSTSGSTVFSGEHSLSSLPAPSSFIAESRVPGSPGSTFNNMGAVGASSHVHTATAPNSIVPSNFSAMGRFMTLITNSSQVDNIPSNCVIFSESKPSSAFFRKTFDTHNAGLYVGTSTFSRAKSATTFTYTITWSPSGAHTHLSTPNSPVPFPGAGPTPSYDYNFTDTGDHTHPASPLSLTVFQQFKHLLPFMALANRPVKSGMIVMFKGVSVPSGWKICDGTNGTPDMNGFFLGYDNTENGHGVLKSNKRVDVTTNGYPLPTTDPSSPTRYEILANYATPTVSWPHSHRGPITTSIYTQTAAHGPVSVPHSHTFSPSNLTFPINFTSNFIKLVFIQKE